jgi:hypothetical protein
MNTGKIQSLHYERLAYVYVRQSTPWQVKENRESTERQYHLHALVRVSPTPHRSKANVVAGQRPEEPAPAETPSFLLPTLWVEVGCRHAQTLVGEKERP